jgi:acetoin utilization protein AcuB
MTEPTVAEYMTKIPASADHGLLLADAEERMNIDNIRHLVVLGDGNIVGVLSNRDISVALAVPGVDRKKLTVRDAMSEQPYMCPQDTPISEVARVMEAHRWGCAVVVDGDEAVGVFTTTDALRALRALATGKPAEPAVKPTHLPPVETGAPRVFHLRHHKPISLGTAGVFNTRPG